MNTQTIMGIIVLLLLLGGGVSWYLMENKTTDTPTPVVQEATGDAVITIVRTKEGYEPKEVVISKGDVVEWVNESGKFHWPASDLHPTHGVYPEFDPQRPIADGESWKFQFDQTGVWKYHDHIQANKTGTITVN